MKKCLVAIVLALVCLGFVIKANAIEGSRETSFTHTIENGNITLLTRYSSNFEKWDLTENKDLIIQMEIIQKPANAAMMIENMVAQAFVEGGKELDGKQLDIMDDKLHGDWQPGWYFDIQYKYEEIFLIQAVDENRLQGWGLMIFGLGYHHLEDYRLTEDHLKNRGVTGTEMSIIYNIFIKYDNEEWWHTESLMDDFVVNRDGTFLPIQSGEVREGIKFNHTVENGTVTIETHYYTDIDVYGITDNKKLIIESKVLEQPSNLTLLIEHMHVDASIFALTGDVKGKPYSYMDDKTHTGDQPGFYITPQYHYREIYSIQGADEYNIEGWGIMIKCWGYDSLEEYRASEDNLLSRGAKGTDISVAFDVAIKRPDETYFHKDMITDDFIILRNGTFITNWGGEAEKPPPQYETIYPNAYNAIYPGIVCVICLAIGLYAWDKEHGTIGNILIFIAVVCIFIAIGAALWGSYQVPIKPPTNQ